MDFQTLNRLYQVCSDKATAKVCFSLARKSIRSNNYKPKKVQNQLGSCLTNQALKTIRLKSWVKTMIKTKWACNLAGSLSKMQ